MSPEFSFIVMLGCFIGLIILIVLFVLAIIKTNQYSKILYKPSRNASCPENLLEQIKIEETPSKKADIFLSLMMDDYVLIHKQINEGKKYSDEKQTKRFEQSLTNDVVKVLNSIEGKDIC